MKIRALNLTAFGPFTEKELSFDEVGLHIVYGPNEAGKSSALRGLKALLYGIDERTLDNFIHANDKLRIQGNLLTVDDRELDFIRRKGGKIRYCPLMVMRWMNRRWCHFSRVTPELFESLLALIIGLWCRAGMKSLSRKERSGKHCFRLHWVVTHCTAYLKSWMIRKRIFSSRRFEATHQRGYSNTYGSEG